MISKPNFHSNRIQFQNFDEEARKLLTRISNLKKHWLDFFKSLEKRIHFILTELEIIKDRNPLEFYWVIEEQSCSLQYDFVTIHEEKKNIHQIINKIQSLIRKKLLNNFCQYLVAGYLTSLLETKKELEEAIHFNQSNFSEITQINKNLYKLTSERGFTNAQTAYNCAVGIEQIIKLFLTLEHCATTIESLFDSISESYSMTCRNCKTQCEPYSTFWNFKLLYFLPRLLTSAKMHTEAKEIIEIHRQSVFRLEESISRNFDLVISIKNESL